MQQIEIDFEVFKELTNRRTSEEITYNEVVRSLLRLPTVVKAVPTITDANKPWIVAGTSFPVGSEFLADYKGKSTYGYVKNGKLVLSDGHAFSTPSAAAVYITGSNVNGWRFWKCKLPGASQHVLLERLRGKSH